MKACQIPCNECPFRKNSIPGYLGGVYENGKDLHDMIITYEKPFNCHKTIDKDVVGYDEIGTVKYPVCAGALLYMRKAAKRPRNPIMNDLVQNVDTKLLDNILSVPELLEHHKNSIGFIKINDIMDLSRGKRTHKEVARFIEVLEKQRSEVKQFSFFGDDNWLRIDTMLDILNGKIENEDDLYDIGLDELIESDCYHVLAWLDGEYNNFDDDF